MVGGTALCSQERFQGMRIGSSWGKLLVLCLRESLNSSNSSAQSGDWNGNFPWHVEIQHSEQAWELSLDLLEGQAG